MKILVLGATGLIGHSLYRTLGGLGHDVHATTRRTAEEVAQHDLFAAGSAVCDFDATSLSELEGVMRALRPDAVLNALGITKRRPEIADMAQAIRVNAMFPHELDALCTRLGARMIHFSTDCVFDGTDGPYTEASVTTPIDTYGRTKALGEVRDGAALTIRSSFIGREIYERSELLDWFLGVDEASGFGRVFYSGVSTIFLSEVVDTILRNHTELRGLWQLAAPEPIAKYDLLRIAADAFGWNGELGRNDDVASMPTLDGSRLAAEVGYTVPPWQTMMAELAAEPFPLGPWQPRSS